MAVLLALSAAATVGVADFLGGLASRRVSSWVVVVGAQIAGLLSLLALQPFLPSATYDGRDLLWGAAAGVTGPLGLTQLFRALGKGTMSVVAPISAVIAGSLSVLVGVGLGERPSAWAWLGIALALPSIVLISREDATSPTAASPDVLVSAALAGVGFGLFYVCLDRTGEGSGLIPVLASRAVSVPLLTILAVSLGRLALSGAGRSSGAIAASGVLDISGNVLFLYAVREGLLALGSVIAAMYPASTILLARVVLGERMRPIQLLGLAGAALAIGLVAIG